MEPNGDLLSTLSTSIQSFLLPSTAVHSSSLAYLKTVLDPLATDIASVQKTRKDENRRKRKRNEVDGGEDILQLRQVYTTGLGVRQVWEQARRILDASCTEIERELTARKERQPEVNEGSFVVNGENQILEDEDHELEDGDDREDDMQEDELVDEDDIEDDNDDSEAMENVEDNSDTSIISEQEDPGIYVEDPNHLNDGFFSIDDFNKQTQFLEQQDARGEDDNPSDEDEIDWDADPLAMAMPTTKLNTRHQDKEDDMTGDEEESSDEEDGPTFGDADLYGADSDEDMLDQDVDDLDCGVPGLDNTNDIRYGDFFAPPPKQLSKTKRMRALPKTRPKIEHQSKITGEDDEDELQRAIADVRRDLLESDEDLSDIESGSDAKPSTKNMSTHERQRAAIAAEIRQLEAANVAKKDWTLSGEARAVERPLNSLIEEDLEFERVGKPVPVITAEVSEEIEQLVKRRILAREFDEVIRRRPDATGGANDARRGCIELDDTKAQSGLAEIYEQEHLKATDPGYVDKRSAAVKKQHEEISRLWKDVSGQLDLLSNLHFKPKRTEVEIKTVEDKPTISMEDARPGGLGGNAEQSMLAPQEVYRPGEEKPNGAVVVRKSGASMSKEEMTREEKLRRRRREKERTKKAHATDGHKSTSGPSGNDIQTAKKSRSKNKEQDKSDILSELRKGNVKVVSKKGELQDLDGKKGRRTDPGVLVGGALKL